MTSEIRVNKINNRAGLGTVEYTPTGIIVSGIVTAYEFDGNFDTTPGIVITGIGTAQSLDVDDFVDVGSNIKLGNAGIVTATTFSTANVDVTTDKIVVGTGVTIEANQVATGQATFTGIVTASAFKLSDGSNVGGVESDAQENTLGGTNAGDSFSGTSALKNTLFGYDAGTAITTADVNTALGHSALKTNTQSSYNVAIGYESLKNFDRSDAGGQNTAVGWQSGDAMTSGRYNSLLGGASGGDITDGEQNSCFGYAAGRSITSGSTNTCIGYGAGKDSNQTGNNNIIIGNDAESSSTSVSNEITLGDSNISLFRVPGINLTFGNNGAVIAGVVTATSFSGDGSSLSNLPAGAPVGGASTNTVFFENDKAVAVNYQITSTKNAMSAGPIAINAGIAVTVPSGSSWTIV